ncbi:MAG TPA: MmpS family transport accessory protein [Roseiflexaceae bacterium]|nr:MmpS family transport accessory protein [Roseiflexaceae bacterium]
MPTATLSAVPTATPTPSPTPGMARVIYRVTGTALRAHVEYDTESRDGVQEEVDLPWSVPVDLSRGKDVVLTALNQDETGSVRCAIEADGVVLASEEVVDSPDTDAICLATVP